MVYSAYVSDIFSWYPKGDLARFEAEYELVEYVPKIILKLTLTFSLYILWPGENYHQIVQR